VDACVAVAGRSGACFQGNEHSMRDACGEIAPTFFQTSTWGVNADLDWNRRLRCDQRFSPEFFELASRTALLGRGLAFP